MSEHSRKCECEDCEGPTVHCGVCAGSGEGCADGVRCSECRGTGGVLNEREPILLATELSEICLACEGDHPEAMELVITAVKTHFGIK